MREETEKLVEYLSSVVERRYLATEHHCSHVSQMTKILLTQAMNYFPEYNLSQEDCEMISAAAAAHDLGKIAISDRILLKPGRLTQDEREIYKSHTRKGKKIFDNFLKMLDPDYADYRFYQYCAEVCMSHHERYDGSGYPEGLKGDEIPLSAQVVGLADIYDVLVSERIYKIAYTKDDAYEMILSGDCGVFAPRLIDLFQMLRLELEEVLDQDRVE